MLKPVYPEGFRKLQMNRGIEFDGYFLRLYWNGDDRTTPTTDDALMTVMLTDDDKVWLVHQLLGITNDDKDNT